MSATRGTPETVLERFLAEAALRGEHVAATTRLVLALLFLARNLATGSIPKLLEGDLQEWIIEPVLLFGAFASFASLRRRTVDATLPGRLVRSVLVDALALAAIFLAIVRWPSPEHAGVLLRADTGIFALAAAATGLRLSRSAARIGIAALAVALVGIATFDALVNLAEPPRLAAIIAHAILFAGAALLGLRSAVSTRSLVVDGANAMREAELVRQRLGAYVSEEVAARALSDDAQTLGGRRQQVTVLFSDLRGFTRYAEAVTPEALVAELNAYLEAVVAAVRAEGGVVDKYIGDAVMAVFGVPDPRPDDALRAMRAARRMHEALAKHNEERRARGLPALVQGIGVHTGAVIAGHIGTAQQMQYTVVGDAVNVASRLEAATKELAVDVLVSDECLRAAQAAGAPLPATRALGAVHVRGREAHLSVHTFVTPAGDA